MKAKYKSELNFLCLDGKTEEEIEQFLYDNGYESAIDNENFDGTYINVWKESGLVNFSVGIFVDSDSVLIIVDYEIVASSYIDEVVPIIVMAKQDFERLFEVIDE